MKSLWKLVIVLGLIVILGPNVGAKMGAAARNYIDSTLNKATTSVTNVVSNKFLISNVDNVFVDFISMITD